MKRKVIFFDRDGVINNNEHYYTYKWEDFSFNPGVIETMLVLQNEGYDFIVISNQSGIAKGLYSIIDVEKLHEQISLYLQKKNLNILEFYYCTHHPDFSNCLCRKPSPLLFEKAIARFNIDTSQSWMIGDQPRDIEAAEKVGIKGILIEPNSDLRQIRNVILKQ
ncbi:MAG: D-glycero-alpha-D-manno-heptose-1,7-bisphosphate 7-phosphatase [Bacteroidales bacterium]